jgi:hypothetical protein
MNKNKLPTIIILIVLVIIFVGSFEYVYLFRKSLSPAPMEQVPASRNAATSTPANKASNQATSTPCQISKTTTHIEVIFPMLSTKVVYSNYLLGFWRKVEWMDSSGIQSSVMDLTDAAAPSKTDGGLEAPQADNCGSHYLQIVRDWDIGGGAVFEPDSDKVGYQDQRQEEIYLDVKSGVQSFDYPKDFYVR